MEDYSSSLFLQCFIRLSCEVGYPKKLLLDEGIQLITGCDSMKTDFQDIKFQLHQQMNVDCEQLPMSNCGSSHAHESRAKNSANQRINSKNNHERATINTSMGGSSCSNLKFHQQSIFSHWKHNWWPLKKILT